LKSLQRDDCRRNRKVLKIPRKSTHELITVLDRGRHLQGKKIGKELQQRERSRGALVAMQDEGGGPERTSGGGGVRARSSILNEQSSKVRKEGKKSLFEVKVEDKKSGAKEETFLLPLEGRHLRRDKAQKFLLVRPITPAKAYSMKREKRSPSERNGVLNTSKEKRGSGE